MSRVLLEQRDLLWGCASALTGVQLMTRLSDLTDALVLRISDCALEQDPSAADQIAVVAVGGYGRQEMAPFSDVDVAFLVRGEQDDRVDRVAKRAFRMLMDVTDGAGLRVGYSYRCIEELEHLPLDAQTALLDARCIAGSRALSAAFQAALRSAIVPIAFVTAHVDNRASASDTPFAVQPDIKEGAGGLRDLHAIRWLAQVAFGLTDGSLWAGLRARGVITDADIVDTGSAHEFHSRTRNTLHLLTRSARDVLTSPQHEAVAAQMGFGSAESFLSTYYRHAHFLSRLLAKVSDAALECELFVESGVVARNGRLRILDKGLLARDPAATIRLFRHAQSYHLRFSRDTADMIAESSTDAGLKAESAHLLPDVLSSPGAGSTIREMAESGVLQTVIPQFGELMYLIPGDAAHRFTVGEHCLRAVEALEGLLGDSSGRFGDIFSRLQHLDVLFLATLVHDIGKLDSSGNHAKTGALRAAKLARTLGMTDDAIRKVEFLVRNHLKMSETARLRDLQQKRTISAFAALVQDPQILDMLFLLTLADARSVGSNGWSEVQARFLMELHERTMTAIRLPDAAGPDLERHRKRVRRELSLANLPLDEVDEHCASMPASYLLNTSPDDLAAHIGYVRTVRDGSCAVEMKDEPAGHFTVITIAATDQPGLLCKIAGVLQALRIDVHAAQVYTRHSTDDIAIDLLYVDFEGRQLAETRKWQLETELLSVLTGEVDVRDLLARMGRNHFQRPKEVATRVCENLSDHHTVVEIRTEDTPGLLYYLTSVISEADLNIHSARIATWGHEVRDAFYLTTREGDRLSREDLVRLSAAL